MVDNRFERFESEAMKNIIAEDSSISEVLERQYKSAKIIDREFTGCGFLLIIK